jgi:hypothetical protein
MKACMVRVIKKNKMKKIILPLIPFLLFSFSEESWKEIYNKEGITIKFRKADCFLDNSFKQRWFLLSFTNSSSVKIKLAWNVDKFDEQNKCVTCSHENGENSYSLIIEPGETKQGECNFSTPPELKIVSELLDVKTSMSYPEFKLSDVRVAQPGE